MKKHLLTIFTQTPLHVGCGSSVGALDQPVQRERHTNYPIIPGSAIKGVLRNHFYHQHDGDKDDKISFCDSLFGKATKDESHAGTIAFSEAKILCFPLRSAIGSFALVTCCHALARLNRSSGNSLTLPPLPKSGECLAGSLITLKDNKVVLEEYAFDSTGTPDLALTQKLCQGLISDPVLEASVDRIVILSDEDFSFFVKNSTEIRNHNRIDPETGTVDGSGFFNEEIVPSEALFIASLFPTTAKEDSPILELLSEGSLLQFGGNNTTGLGFCSVKSQPAS